MVDPKSYKENILKRGMGEGERRRKKKKIGYPLLPITRLGFTYTGKKPTWRTKWIGEIIPNSSVYQKLERIGQPQFKKENMNSNILFYKDCSLGSVKPVCLYKWRL